MAYLVAQMVENLPAMQETQVRSLGWENVQEKGMATHLNVLAWRNPWTEEPGQATVCGCHSADASWSPRSGEGGSEGVCAPGTHRLL